MKNEIQYLGVSLDSRAKWEKEIKQVALRRMKVLNGINVLSESRGSSGSIVSDYGLDDWVIEVRSPAGAEDFSSSPCIQTSSEAHPASYPMGTGDPFPRGKTRPGHDADHSPPSSAKVKYE
jgi:hypothetical protein